MTNVPCILLQLIQRLQKRPASPASAKKVLPKSMPGRYRHLSSSLPVAAMVKTKAKASKKCSRPRCTNDAVSTRSKFCTACFKKNASLASSKRKAFGGGGVLGNSGNTTTARGKVVFGNGMKCIHIYMWSLSLSLVASGFASGSGFVELVRALSSDSQSSGG
jgi:hypothetical protein